MLIESYVIEFTEVKRCIASLRPEDFIVISENIFALTDKPSLPTNDLLAESTPDNHPEALLLVNKHYAKSLILNDDFFEFLKKSHNVDNLRGVTLHLAFASQEMIKDLTDVSAVKSVDGIKIKTVGLEALLLAQKNQNKRYQENQTLFKKSIAIYRTDM
ncbi:MAG: hypothetical protein K9J47_09070 [Sulfuritalea sp.]|nr:hypothetical protein [Polynucleobacter sp.]MCF8188912.1 hypothetical protein [Sulfuritalea sp.]